MFKRYDAYIVGYYGMRNSGDDALMLASIWGAQKLLGLNRVKVACSEHTPDLGVEWTKNLLPSPPQFRGQHRAKHYLAATQSNRLIFGGGSVLHTEKDIEMKRHLMKLSSKSQSMAIGIGIGPFENKRAQNSCAKFLNECGFVGLRDQQSYELALKIAPNANLHNSFDLTPLLSWHPEFKIAQKREGILINLCPLALNAFGMTDSMNEAKRVSDMAQVIEAVHKNTGQPISVMDMNGHDLYGDWQLSSALSEKLAGRVPLEIIPYNSNPLQVINKISSFKSVVSMRLHGNIFAYLAGVPTVALNYHRKCWQWCDQAGIPEEYQFHAKQFDKVELVEAIEESTLLNSGNQALDVEVAVNNSLKNWNFKHEEHRIFSRNPFVQQRKAHC